MTKKTLNISAEQLKIRLGHLKYKHESRWYRECPFGSVGSILHWLYVYGQLNIAERTTISFNKASEKNYEGDVTLYGKQIATFKFNDKIQMPVFEFSDEYDWLSENQQIYLSGIGWDNDTLASMTIWK